MTTKVINLLKNYNKPNISDLVKSIININFDIRELSNHINFKKNEYNKSILYRDSKYEIVLICWAKHSSTEIHNHPENGCIMKILKGNLLEECFNIKTLDKIKINMYEENNVSYIHDDLYLHKIINKDQETISLHIYSPPNFYN
jgi:hypothetical protein